MNVLFFLKIEEFKKYYKFIGNGKSSFWNGNESEVFYLKYKYFKEKL